MPRMEPTGRTHELKIRPEFFDAWRKGDKRAEVRLNDRDFKVGDAVLLREFDPKKKKRPYTGRSILCDILHMVSMAEVPGTHKADAAFVVLSLSPRGFKRASPSAA